MQQNRKKRGKNARAGRLFVFALRVSVSMFMFLVGAAAALLRAPFAVGIRSTITSRLVTITIYDCSCNYTLQLHYVQVQRLPLSKPRSNNPMQVCLSICNGRNF